MPKPYHFLPQITPSVDYHHAACTLACASLAALPVSAAHARLQQGAKSQGREWMKAWDM